MAYADYMQQLSPPWLLGTNGLAWNKGLGAEIDTDLIGNAKLAVKSRFPYVAAPVWQASTLYATSASVLPTQPNGYLYTVTTGGTSGTAQPPFPTMVGATVADGSVTWTNAGAVFTCPTDALDQIGSDRGMARLPGESDYAYAGRLINAWTTWKHAGTAYSILAGLYAAGYTNVAIAQQNGMYWTYPVQVLTATKLGYDWDFDNQSPLGSPAIWNPSTAYNAGAVIVRNAGQNGYWYRTDKGGTSGNSTPPWSTTIGAVVSDNGINWVTYYNFWSRFAVIFLSPLPASWQSGGVPASSANEANLIRGIIKQWNSAGATCVEIQIQATGTHFWGQPSQTWGASSTWGWGGSTVTSWSP